LTGAIVQTKALPAEIEDRAIADLPRLRFRFDRRGMGRPRQQEPLSASAEVDEQLA